MATITRAHGKRRVKVNTTQQMADCMTQIAENHDNAGARLTAAHELKALFLGQNVWADMRKTKTTVAAANCLDEVLGAGWHTAPTQSA